MPLASTISQRRTSALKEGSAEYLAKCEELVASAAQRFKHSDYRATTLA